MSENRVIGQDNRLAWHLSNDLKRFKAITMDKPIVMGRKTYESIGRPLPGRQNIILTTQRDLVIPGCDVMHSVDEILEKTQEASELMITGGGEIYRLFLPFVTRMYITFVKTSLSNGTTFPDLDYSQWKEIFREEHQKDEKHDYDYSFVTFDRV